MPTFDTPSPISATIEVPVGDIRLIASDRTDTVVHVRPTDAGTDLDVHAAEQTRVEYTDGRLLVTAPKPRGLGLFRKSGSVDVEISLPSGSRLRGAAQLATFHSTGSLGECSIKISCGDVHLEHTGALDLSTGSGQAVVGAVGGPARISTGTGSLRISSIDGDAALKNANGHSWVGRVGGAFAASAANGDILVEEAQGDVNAASSNGHVRIGAVTRGSVSMKTACGELELGIPAGTPAYLDLSTGFGTVHNRLDKSEAPKSGEETVTVRGRTSYGDIIIRRPR